MYGIVGVIDVVVGDSHTNNKRLSNSMRMSSMSMRMRMRSRSSSDYVGVIDDVVGDSHTNISDAI